MNERITHSGAEGNSVSKSDLRIAASKELILVNAAEYIDCEPPPTDSLLSNIFDKGDKVAIIGQTKTRKSFFTLQFALCMASGHDFLSYTVPSPRNVLLVQFEIKPSHYHKRVYEMAHALDISSSEINRRLIIANARGKAANLRHIAERASDLNIDLIILDPLYKIESGDENSSEDRKRILAKFDEMAETSQAAVAYVHHDRKGSPGELEASDRGSGSGVLSRDYDAAIILTPHQDNTNCLVAETLLRNYAPQDKQAFEWQDYCFRPSSELPIKKGLRGSRRANDLDLSKWLQKGQDVLNEHISMAVSAFDVRLGGLGATRQQQKATRDQLIFSEFARYHGQKATRGGTSRIIALASVVTDDE